MQRSIPLRAGWLVAAALVAVSCASDGTSSSSSSSGSISERSRPSGPRTIDSFPPETQAFMKAGLHQFSKGDPQWNSTRAAWLAKGPAETGFLVETLWIALVKAQADELPNAPQLVEKARHELALIGEPSIELMAAFLGGGTLDTTVDPDTGEQRDIVIDDQAKSEASAVLGLIGAPAIPAVRATLERAPTKSGKRYALQTLGNIGDRGGEQAYEPLIRYAHGDDEVLRVEAVYSLRFFHDETTRSVLIQALGDADDLVRRKAADALRTRRDSLAVPYIRAAADRARADAKLVEAGELDRAAAWIEQHPK